MESREVMVSLGNVSVVTVPPCNTVYETAQWINQHLSLLEFNSVKEIPEVQLRNIITLHNVAGMSLEKIPAMIETVKKGGVLCTSQGLPNIRLACIGEEYLVFDGHHSLLAYIAAGKKLLSQIPFLLIEIEEKDISDFFIEHKEKVNNWRDIVVNWKSPKETQIEKRIQKNMGELFDAVKGLLRPTE